MLSEDIDAESSQPQWPQNVKIPWSSIGTKSRDGLFALVGMLAVMTGFSRSDYNAPLFAFLYANFNKLQSLPNKRCKHFFIALIVFSILYDLVWWSIQGTDPLGPDGMVAENLSSLALIVVWFSVFFKIAALVIIRQSGDVASMTNGPAPPGFYYWLIW